MKKSPKQQILELLDIKESDAQTKWADNTRQYKAQLLEQIIKYLDRESGQSESDLKDRLLGDERKDKDKRVGSISNKKLLKLYHVVERLKQEFDGKKDRLVDILLHSKKGVSGKTDQGYRTHLEKKSISSLFLMYDHAKKTGQLQAE
jgi:hypothetical protein